MMKRERIVYRILPDGLPQIAVGRNAWALKSLYGAGESGCTPIDHPGPRWSGYKFNLKQAGLEIEAKTEKHGGPYPGTHARYILKSDIEIIDDGEGV